MKSTLIACLALATLSFTSCKKDKDEAVTPTKENLAGTYTLTAITMSANGSDDIPADIREACAKDDTYTLNANGAFTIKDEGTKCDPVGDETGTWSLGTNSKITFDGLEHNIVSFNGKTLVVSFSIAVNGMSSVYKETYTKK